MLRRLLNFAVVDDEGEPQHLDRLELLGKPILLSGACAVHSGKGCRCLGLRQAGQHTRLRNVTLT